jgi:hypothetical protein
MDTNVGEMPLDIFSDYVSDILGEDWSWEYFGIIVWAYTNFDFQYIGNEGSGYGMIHQIIFNRGNGYVANKGYGFTFTGNGQN